MIVSIKNLLYILSKDFSDKGGICSLTYIMGSIGMAKRIPFDPRSWGAHICVQYSYKEGVRRGAKPSPSLTGLARSLCSLPYGLRFRVASRPAGDLSWAFPRHSPGYPAFYGGSVVELIRR